MIDSTALVNVQGLLAPGENVLWAGRPGQGIRPHASDLYLIPFSVLWGGFAIFWEVNVIASSKSLFMALWGIPFVLVGLYFMFGRFFWDAFVRARQTYVVTNQRLIIQRGGSVSSSSLTNLPQLNLRTNSKGAGSIDFGQYGNGSGYGNRGLGIWSPSSGGQRFVFLDDAQEVFRIIQRAQAAARNA